MNREEKEYLEDVSKQVEEIRHIVEREEAMLVKQLKPAPSMFQRILKWILNVFGTIYVLIEQFVKYTDDDRILGMDIDDDLQVMSRQQLCRYMDAVLPEKGFFDIQSTSKIRLGCQLLREFKQLKKVKQKNLKSDIVTETGSYGDVDF
jgi:hypothetical protein|tara:strand:+ start:62 stop:505 length:444 start_codon:yes stop_codon:yes gene_type:complete